MTPDSLRISILARWIPSKSTWRRLREKDSSVPNDTTSPDPSIPSSKSAPGCGLAVTSGISSSINGLSAGLMDQRLEAFVSPEFDRVFGAVASLAGAADEERLDVAEIE